jgi:thioredoxin 1
MSNDTLQRRNEMLRTNLKHLETETEVRDVLASHENVVVCCGRMGPMCVPVYCILEELKRDYAHVVFYDQDFDIPAAGFIKDLPECSSFMGLPFTVYFRNGQAAAATTSIQRKAEIEETLNVTFGRPAQMIKG